MLSTLSAKLAPFKAKSMQAGFSMVEVATKRGAFLGTHWEKITIDNQADIIFDVRINADSSEHRWQVAVVRIDVRTMEVVKVTVVNNPGSRKHNNTIKAMAMDMFKAILEQLNNIATEVATTEESIQVAEVVDTINTVTNDTDNNTTYCQYNGYEIFQSSYNNMYCVWDDNVESVLTEVASMSEAIQYVDSIPIPIPITA